MIKINLTEKDGQLGYFGGLPPSGDQEIPKLPDGRWMQHLLTVFENEETPQFSVFCYLDEDGYSHIEYLAEINLDISEDADAWGKVVFGNNGFKSRSDYVPLLQRTEFEGERYEGEIAEYEFFTQLGGGFKWLQKPVSEAKNDKLLMQIYYSSINQVKGGEGMLLDGCGYVFQSSENKGKLFFQFT